MSGPDAVPEEPAEAAASAARQRLEDALAGLARLDGLPTVAHATVYEDLHRALQDALGDEAAAGAPDEPGAPRHPDGGARP